MNSIGSKIEMDRNKPGNSTCINNKRLELKANDQDRSSRSDQAKIVQDQIHLKVFMNNFGKIKVAHNYL